jgi:hypothetical protein
MDFPPREKTAPRMKSACPPMPLWKMVPMDSAVACPVRSISIALLMATIRSWRLMFRGLLV